MNRNRSAHLATAAVLGLLAGCATPVFNQASNLPISATTPENMGAPTDFAHRNAIFLSLSGGGLRAAALSYGVFTALDELKTGDGTLLEDVALINSVSGSSLTAACYGFHGREGLRRFPLEVLQPGYESHMCLSLLDPRNLLRRCACSVEA